VSLASKLLIGGSPKPTGSEVFTSSGTWTCPDYVYSVSVVCIGQGGAGATVSGIPYNGGGGGGLGWRNNISVTPGQSYTVSVGDSYFISLGTVRGEDGGLGGVNTVGIGGSYAGDGGFVGGNGGADSGGTSNRIPGAGGDAANYDSNGDNAGPAGSGNGSGTGVSGNNDGPYGYGGAGGTNGGFGVVQIRWGSDKDFP